MSEPTTPSSSIHDGGSIINRGRQTKGITGSFSANLSRRVTPPRSERRDKDGRSVKSIVAWIEASPNSKNTARPRLTPSSSTMASTSRRGSLCASVTTSDLGPKGTPAHDVEDYSLEMLGYRQYFTETPLGRCLDEPKGSEPVNQGETQEDRTEAATQAERNDDEKARAGSESTCVEGDDNEKNPRRKPEVVEAY